ncbi:hypothetical protein ACFXGT_19205 [Streptomyces sp. NPDC059352]|uniref:hypothetical protein n=1 Tax=Streptomyces sp. NPDC059352 TaxID=3346810 RepID=UPI0036A07D51
MRAHDPSHALPDRTGPRRRAAPGAVPGRVGPETPAATAAAIQRAAGNRALLAALSVQRAVSISATDDDFTLRDKKVARIMLLETQAAEEYLSDAKRRAWRQEELDHRLTELLERGTATFATWDALAESLVQECRRTEAETSLVAGGANPPTGGKARGEQGARKRADKSAELRKQTRDPVGGPTTKRAVARRGAREFEAFSGPPGLAQDDRLEGYLKEETGFPWSGRTRIESWGFGNCAESRLYALIRMAGEHPKNFHLTTYDSGVDAVAACRNCAQWVPGAFKSVTMKAATY